MKTKRKLALAISIGLLPLANTALAATFCVDIKKPSCSTKIQDAINLASNNGDTVKIAPGTYNESVDVNKSNLILTGAGCSTFIENCNDTNCGGGVAINVTAPDVTVQKLSIGHAASGIYINAMSGTKITGNCFYDNSEDITGSSDKALISKNSFKGAHTQSIALQTDGAQLTSNKFYNPTSVGHITGAKFMASNNTFTECGTQGLLVTGDSADIHNNSLFVCGDGIRVNGNSASIQRNILFNSLSGINVTGDSAKVINNLINYGNGGVSVIGDKPDIEHNTVTSSAHINVDCAPGNDIDNCSSSGLIAFNQVSYSSNGQSNLSIRGSNLTITNNRLTYSSGHGIGLVGNNTTIKLNAISNSGSAANVDRSGISVEGSKNAIADNIINGSSNAGIKNQSGDNNKYLRNTITKSGRSGLFIRQGNGNLLDLNKAMGNRGEGINNNASATIVTHNTAKSNKTDFCNDGSVNGSLDTNTFGTGNLMTPCKVDKP